MTLQANKPDLSQGWEALPQQQHSYPQAETYSAAQPAGDQWGASSGAGGWDSNAGGGTSGGWDSQPSQQQAQQQQYGQQQPANGGWDHQQPQGGGGGGWDAGAASHQQHPPPQQQYYGQQQGGAAGREQPSNGGNDGWGASGGNHQQGGQYAQQSWPEHSQVRLWYRVLLCPFVCLSHDIDAFLRLLTGSVRSFPPLSQTQASYAATAGPGDDAGWGVADGGGGGWGYVEDEDANQRAPACDPYKVIIRSHRSLEFLVMHGQRAAGTMGRRGHQGAPSAG